MNEEFFTTLPLETVIDIIARLPLRTIISCKCVCKSWLRLIKSHEFAKFHLSYELFPICNPITRQYIQIPHHQPVPFFNREITVGFGASRVTGQLKVVRIFEEWPENHCEIYTLGTGSWRRITHATGLRYVGCNKYGSFLNGNLHWLVEDRNGYSWISCFDLEAELFSTFPSPNPSVGASRRSKMVAPLGDHLCVCEELRSGIVIWLMNEYGVEKSWMKKFVVYTLGIGYINPIKVLNDGGLLIAWSSALQDNVQYSVHYSKKDEVITDIISLKCTFISDAIPHTPSFLLLECFGMEEVRSF